MACQTHGRGIRTDQIEGILTTRRLVTSRAITVVYRSMVGKPQKPFAVGGMWRMTIMAGSIVYPVAEMGLHKRFLTRIMASGTKIRRSLLE